MDLSTRTDGQLLKAHSRGNDPAAFEELYRRYGKLVYSTCLRRLGSAQEAEDASAAVFMVLLRKAPELARSRETIAGWLQWCATNCARKAAWLRSRQQDRERKAAEMREKLKGDDGVKWAAALPHLDEALASLPEAQREVVVQHFMLGRSLSSIAKETRSPEGTVAGRARLGLDKLRRKLVKHGPALSVGVLGAGLTETCAGIALPAGLGAKISAMATGGAAAVGGSAAAITDLTVKAMTWMKIKIAAAVLCSAAVVTGGGAATVSKLLEPGPNQRILAMEDNSWLRLDPPREARGRAYCGVSFGGGYFWYFGGGKRTYLANDVNLYDARLNQWIQATPAEQPQKGSKNWLSMTDSGGYTHNTAPSGNPYAEQSYQQICWVPQRERFLVLLVSSGTWEFDPGTHRWHHLVNRWENPEAEPRGSWAQNTVVYDPGLKAPVHAITSGPDRYLRVFDYGEMSWRRLGKFPGLRDWSSWYATWVPEWQAHLVMSGGKDGPKFYRFSAASMSASPIDAPAELKTGGAIACDPANRVVIVLEPGKLDRPWKLDTSTMKWEQLTSTGTAPAKGGLWNTLRFDPEHKAFLFLSFHGNQGKFVGGKSEIWAYRFKSAPSPDSE
jgi:RNA polymerase sigma factor (sigma-70 family)